jgi:hypothetical protein
MGQRTLARPAAWIMVGLVAYASLFPVTGWRTQDSEFLGFLWAPWPRYWTGFDVLGNLLGVAGFEYLSSEEVRDELRRELGEYAASRAASAFAPGRLASLDVTREVGLYAVDAVVRRSRP